MSPAGISVSGTDPDHDPLVYYRNGELAFKNDRPVYLVRVYNLMGQMVLARRGSNIRTVHTGHVGPGLYLVLIQSGGDSFRSKVYIQGP